MFQRSFTSGVEANGGLHSKILLDQLTSIVDVLTLSVLLTSGHLTKIQAERESIHPMMTSVKHGNNGTKMGLMLKGKL